MKLVFGLVLFEIELKFEKVDISFHTGHGVYAALVEQEGVVAAVCIGGGVVDHGLVFVGHGHILVCERPTGGLYAGLGGGGGGVGVEVVGIGEVGIVYAAVALVGEVGLDCLAGRDGKGVGGVGRQYGASTGPVGESVARCGSGAQGAAATTVVGAAASHGAASCWVGSDGDGVSWCEVGLDGLIAGDGE